MSSPVFVRDAQGTLLMPTSPAYARRLLQSGKARWVPHHAFPVIQLTQTIQQPTLRPILLGIAVHLNSADLYLITSAEHSVLLLLHCIVDLRTDLPTRLRRRAAHRKRRKRRARYRRPRRQGVPFKLRRPSMLKSIWDPRKRLRRSAVGARGKFSPPIMRWRAQSITRVIRALQTLLPISHAVILSPAELRELRYDRSSQLRQRLIDTYGQLDPDGSRRPMCAYCLTTEGRIEAEHVIPLSRGGTDGWQNRVLACAACNARKGDRLPEEAGMPLRITLANVALAPNRAGSYARSTARLLIGSLPAMGLPSRLRDQAHDPRDQWPVQLSEALLKISEPDASHTTFVAKPIARPTKQVFTGRNYPLNTRMRAGMVRVGQTIRRRVRVNQALIIKTVNRQRAVQVVPTDTAVPKGAAQIIVLGLLCEALRRDQRVTGIVSAIHSTGRLTLLVPVTVSVTGIHWHRVVVSPRQHLRVLSTDPVIFMPAPSGKQSAG